MRSGIVIARNRIYPFLPGFGISHNPRYFQIIATQAALTLRYPASGLPQNYRLQTPPH